jgi:hypothetical protein
VINSGGMTQNAWKMVEKRLSDCAVNGNDIGSKQPALVRYQLNTAATKKTKTKTCDDKGF